MPLTRDQMRRESLTAREAIAKYKRGRVSRRFPSQFLDSKIDEIEAAAAAGDRDARSVTKLLFQHRFDK
jgi:hypothetical protein